MAENEHYFYIAKRGHYYVAAVSLTEPTDEEVPASEKVIGAVNVMAMDNPNDMRAWIQSMSEASNRVVAKAFAWAGFEMGAVETETVLDFTPKVN